MKRPYRLESRIGDGKWRCEKTYGTAQLAINAHHELSTQSEYARWREWRVVDSAHDMKVVQFMGSQKT